MYGPYGGYDIAILRMELPIKFSKWVLPICLPSDQVVLAFRNPAPLTMVGFGHEEPVIKITSNMSMVFSYDTIFEQQKTIYSICCIGSS